MPREIVNLVGQRFGLLVVMSDSGDRNKKGQVVWRCKCDCGNEAYAIGTNLRNGSVSSCKCLQRAKSAERRRAAKKPPAMCACDGCADTTAKGGHGYCGKHAQRLRRHGDVDAVTAECERRTRQRESLLSNMRPAKPDTYKKMFGVHEHRRVGEILAGRPLRSDEHVHHINGDKHDNRIENLVVLSREEHLELHAHERGKK